MRQQPFDPADGLLKSSDMGVAAINTIDLTIAFFRLRSSLTGALLTPTGLASQPNTHPAIALVIFPDFTNEAQYERERGPCHPTNEDHPPNGDAITVDGVPFE